MIFTFDQIKEILTDIKKPYIELYYKDGITSEKAAGVFSCDICKEDDTPEEKTAQALKWLENFVTFFPKGTTFILYAKHSFNVTKKGAFGPYTFKLDFDEKFEQNITGLSGQNMNFDELGYIPKGRLEAELAKQKLAFFEENHKRDLEDLKKEMEIKFQLASQWSPEHIDRIGATIAGIIGQFKGNAPVQLAGPQKEAQTSQTPETEDIKANAVNSFARELYENADIVMIEKLRHFVRNQNEQNSNTEPENKPEDE